MSENDAAKKFAYRKGQVARQHGKSLNANPYDAETCYAKCWVEGWQAEDRPKGAPFDSSKAQPN